MSSLFGPSQPYLWSTTGGEVRILNVRRPLPAGTYLVAMGTPVQICVVARSGGPLLGWTNSLLGMTLFRTTTVSRPCDITDFSLPTWRQVPLPFERGVPLGYALTDEEWAPIVGTVRPAQLTVVLGQIRLATVDGGRFDNSVAVYQVFDSRLGHTWSVDSNDSVSDHFPNWTHLDASPHGARHAVASLLRSLPGFSKLDVIVAADWGLNGLATLDGYGVEEFGGAEVRLFFEPPEALPGEERSLTYIRHARQALLEQDPVWARLQGANGDWAWSRLPGTLKPSLVRLPAPPQPFEQDLSSLWDEVQGATDVWVWNGNMGGTQLSPRAPWPLQRNRWASYESPFRGYVRGRLVGLTNQFAIVAVTHLCRRFGRDLIKTNEGIFLYGEDRPADYTLGEIGRYGTDYPPEIAYSRPIVRLFELGNVRAWGPWTRDPNAGDGMIAHWVVGPITPADEPVPCVGLREYLNWTPRMAWDSLPALADVYTDFDEFAQWQGIPDPHGLATAQGGFHADRLEVEPGLGNTVVLVYEGIEVRVIEAEAFNIAAPDPIEILDIRYIDREVHVPTYVGRDGEWLLDGLGAFMDGSWVRDAHDALYGVWLAADRASGLTASAGLADATNAAALGVAHAIAAGGYRDEDYHDAWSWLWTWPGTAYNFVVFQGAMLTAHLSGTLARALPSQVRRPTQPLYEAALSAVGYNHNQATAIETLYQVHDRWQQSILVQAQIAALEMQMGDYRRALRLNDLAAEWVMDQWHGLVRRYGDREREDVNLHQL